ncbi:MAG: flagellar hook-associated protein FlgK [Bacillota bacterium]
MSLLGALNTGKAALATHQAALQVTSNNVANAGDPNYTRQVARLSPNPDYPTQTGFRIGTGVSLIGIERQIDEALEERIRGSMSENELANTRQSWLSRVESVFNPLGETPLSTQLSSFFKNWSGLANTPTDTSQRQLVITSGESLANSLHSIRSQLSDLGDNAQTKLTQLAQDANGLADQIAKLNGQILAAEGASGSTANALRDQRDAAIKELSKLIDVTVQQNGNGTLNVSVGSTPLVLNDVNRGIATVRESDGKTITTKLVIKADGSAINASNGQIGALQGVRTEITDIIDQLDTLTGNLIFELNHLHSQGQGSTTERTQGFAQVSATNAVSDANAALNSAAAGLDFKPTNGTFIVNVRRKSDGGIVSASTVKIDLSDSGGDSLNTLAGKLDALSGISASIVGGKLQIEAEDKTNTEITFAEDHSYVLAALGINSFFTGTSAGDIAINSSLKSNPSLLAVGNKDGANANARAIAALNLESLDRLGGTSLQGSYETMINGIAASTDDATTNAEASQAVLDTLTSQREALSGVSLDEEAINLIREQRAYQAAARIISMVDEMMKTLLQMV